MEDFQEIKEVWRGEIVRAIKSGRAVVLGILFLLFTGLALTVVGFFNHQINSQAALAGAGPEAAERTLAAKKQFVSFFFTDDAALLDVLAAMPLVLLVVFKLSVRFVPLFVALMGFDQLSGEVGPKSIRYLIVRVKRSSIIIGKFLSQTTMLAALLTFGVLVMTIVAKLLNDDFATSDVALTFVKLSISALALGVAYLGLTTLCSALARQGAVSLVLNIILLFVVWFVAFIGEAYRLPGEEAALGSLAQLRPESAAGYMRYASVWHYGQDLLHPHFLRAFSSGLVHVGFALLFLGFAHLALRRRDL